MTTDLEFDANGEPLDSDYWHALINEREAAKFLGLSPRTLQGFRQDMWGPDYVVVSTRCIRYRRGDLKAWADNRMRRLTHN